MQSHPFEPQEGEEKLVPKQYKVFSTLPKRVVNSRR
jgi:hypothetical protein